MASKRRKRRKSEQRQYSNGHKNIKKRNEEELNELYETWTVEAQKSKAKGQHITAESYLRRWEENGLIRVTDLTKPSNSKPVSPKYAGKINNFYTLPERITATGIPPLMIETLLSKTERIGNTAISVLLDKPASFTPTHQTALAQFIAVQYLRGVRPRKLHQEIADLTIRIAIGKLPIIHDEDRKIRINGPISTALSMQLAEECAAHLRDRAWVLYETPATLITCDEPVILVKEDKDSRQAVGLYTADLILFPLSPCRCLALYHPDLAKEHVHKPSKLVSIVPLDEIITVDLCRLIGQNAERWLYERPSKKVTANLKFKPRQGPIVHVENMGITKQLLLPFV